MNLRLPTVLFAAVTVLVSQAAQPKSRAVSRKVRQGTPAVAQAGNPSGLTLTAHRRDPYVGAISADAKTGKVLFESGADAEAYPASVTKLMTALLVLEDVKAGRYALTDRVVATPEAYYSESSWVGIKAGQSMTVDDLLMSLLVMSANDAAIMLGVKSAGSLDAFVARMNERARQLGMTHTCYYNPNGLPPNAGKRYPWKQFNRTTARDQLKLALAIIKLPQIFRYTSSKTATVTDGNGKPLKMLNHNRILRMDKFHIINPDGTEAVDGLKTGYINAGGSSIVITGKRNGHRAVVVVLGSASSDIREAQASRLLSDALGAIAW